MTAAHPDLSRFLAPLALGTARGGMLRLGCMAACANVAFSPMASGQVDRVFLALSIVFALCLMLDLSAVERASAARPAKGHETRSRADGARLAALATLGLDASASPNEIRNAFRRAAKANHPDSTTGPGDPRRFQEATAAYALLRGRGPAS